MRMYLKQAGDPLDPDQKYLLQSSDLIGGFNYTFVYACYPARLRANDKMYADSAIAIAKNMAAGDTAIGDAGSWFVQHFDGLSTDQPFFGKGACPQIAQKDTDLISIPVAAKKDKQLYESSCWFLLGNENYRSPFAILDLLDSSGQVIGNVNMLTKECTDNKGLWFRGAVYLEVPLRCKNVRCHLVNEPGNTYKVMDELMLRPADALIISKDANGKVLANNHLLN